MKIVGDGAGRRFALVRTWQSSFEEPKNRLAWIGLNPAPLGKNDSCPTHTKMAHISQVEGFDSFVVVNLYSWVSSRPSELNNVDSPIGSQNDKWICEELRKANCIVCAWGDGRGINGFGKRVRSVLKLLKGRRLYCVERTTKGNPVHVSRINLAARLHIWENVFCPD